MLGRYKREEVRKGLFHRYIICTERVAENVWCAYVYRANWRWKVVKLLDCVQGFLPAEVHERAVKKWRGK